MNKVNLKCIKDLNVKPEIMKVLKENIGNSTRYRYRKGFSKWALFTQGLSPTINKRELIKLECFHAFKETLK